MKGINRILVVAGIIALILALVVIPPIARGYWDLGQAESLRLSSPGQAAARYKSAALLLPWRDDLWEQAGLMALTDDDPDLALQLFDRSSELSAKGSMAQGDALYRTGKVDSALLLWEKLRDEGSASAQLLNRIGHVYYEQHRFEEASEAFLSSVKLDDTDSDSYYMLGLLLATQSPQEAVKALIKAGQLDPKLDPVVQSLRAGLNAASLLSDKSAQLTSAGRTLAGAGSLLLAREALENAIKSDPQYAPAWAWLGYVKQSFQEDGLAELDRALQLDRNSAEIRSLRAVYFLRENNFEKAKAEFEEAARLDPQNADWQIALGDLTARTGDIQKGLEYYQHAVELSPNKADYWRAMANFIIDYNGSIQEIGLPAALKARALAPDDPQNSITLGRVFYSLGELDAAEKIWTDVLQKNPDLPSIHLYLGVLYLQEGNSELAYQHLLQTVNLDENGPYGSQASRMLDQYFP